MRRLIIFAAIVTSAFVGGGTAARGAWIYVKAQAAQYLIERAWTQNAFEDGAVAPWPWADTHVLARLRVPARDIQQFVLAGAHGQALAFGPGHLSGTAMPGEPGNSVIAGHRDTHFRFLRDLDVGDEILFDLPHGRTVRYRVLRIWVTTDTDLRPLAERAQGYLTLITCYPFDALSAGGPLRFVVEAQA
jgi:sortase A